MDPLTKAIADLAEAAYRAEVASRCHPDRPHKTHREIRLLALAAGRINDHHKHEEAA